MPTEIHCGIITVVGPTCLMDFNTLYVSGPMTGYPNKNFPSFINATYSLRSLGYKVVSPAELDQSEVCYTWEDCLRRDIKAMMESCNGVATLPDGKNLKGHA